MIFLRPCPDEGTFWGRPLTDFSSRLPGKVEFLITVDLHHVRTRNPSFCVSVHIQQDLGPRTRHLWPSFHRKTPRNPKKFGRPSGALIKTHLAYPVHEKGTMRFAYVYNTLRKTSFYFSRYIAMKSKEICVTLQRSKIYLYREMNFNVA